jgi:hypothetical protein
MGYDGRWIVTVFAVPILLARPRGVLIFHFLDVIGSYVDGNALRSLHLRQNST